MPLLEVQRLNLMARELRKGKSDVPPPRPAAKVEEEEKKKRTTSTTHHNNQNCTQNNRGTRHLPKNASRSSPPPNFTVCPVSGYFISAKLKSVRRPVGP